MRLVVAKCSVDYAGRLSAHLPLATRVLMLKQDGSLLIHSDGGSYKPLNWMSPPCTLTTHEPEADQADVGVTEIWRVTHAKTADMLVVNIYEIYNDVEHELGEDPGLIKNGVEAELQELLAAHIELLGEGYTLVRREYFTAIGPVDILARDENGNSVAVEIKRRGEIDGVEQLTRYIDCLHADSSLGAIRGIFVAQTIKPQARVLAESRGFGWCEVDYDELRGKKSDELRLF